MQSSSSDQSLPDHAQHQVGQRVARVDLIEAFGISKAVNDAIVINCTSCGRSFESSIFGSTFPVGFVVLKGNRERCPHCGDFSYGSDGVIVPIEGQGRYLPVGTRATKRNRLLSDPKDVKKAYFAIGYDRPLSNIWKIERGGQGDVYLMCRDFPQFKLSIHKSKEDNLGFTKEYFKQNPDAKSNGRHFFVSNRTTLPLAHHMRIMHIKLTNYLGWEKDFFPKKLEDTKKRFLRLAAPLGQTMAFNVYYTEGHPFDYEETSADVKNVMAILRGFKNQYLSVYLAEPDILDNHYESYELQRASTIEDGICLNNTIRFGKTLKNTFLVDVSLRICDGFFDPN